MRSGAPLDSAMNEEVTRFWWIRHAPVPDHSDRIYGNTDLDCDTGDRASFEALAARLPRDAIWVVSHLRRTSQTAAALGRAGYPLPELVVDSDLGEQDFGELHGLLHSDNTARRTDPFVGFWDLPPHERAPGGESLCDVRERVERAIDRLADEHSGRDLVCVAHGGPIRCALAIALGIDVSQAVVFSVRNLSLTRIESLPAAPPGAPRWRVRGVGELCG